MIVGLSGGAGAAGTGVDPSTGGMIACNPGDTFDPTTAMRRDNSGDAPEYYGTLTLPPLGAGLSTAVPVVAAAATSNTMLYLGLAVAAIFLFKGMGRG